MEGEVDYHGAFVLLFREAFEGRPDGQDYTWFVQGKEGLFDVLESLDAKRASRRVTPECSSVFAHLSHARYALWLSNSYVRGENPDSDWEGSWAKQKCTEEEWRQLKADMRREYADLVSYFNSRPEWPEQDWLIGAIALLPHMAYHLGAVRQLMKV